GADAGTLRGSARGVGAAARSGIGTRRAAHLRVAQVDHVRAQDLLLLRAAEAELPRGLRVPRPSAETPAHSPGRPVVEDEIRAPGPDHASRRGRGAADGLAAGSVRAAGRSAARDRSNDEEGKEG